MSLSLSGPEILTVAEIACSVRYASRRVIAVEENRRPGQRQSTNPLLIRLLIEKGIADSCRLW